MLRNLLYLLGGIALLFLSLYLFKQPAKWSAWDFSTTGQIGDTIGGVTAPIINILGAFLVYISFREQVRANRLQTLALNEEKERNENTRSFEHFQALFDKVIQSFKDLEFMVIKTQYTTHNPPTYQTFQVTYKGFNAMAEYIFRLENLRNNGSNYDGEISDNKFGMFLEIRFLLANILEFTERIDNTPNIHLDRKYFQESILSFYEISIKELLERMLDVLSLEDEKVTVVVAIKGRLEAKLDSFR